MRSSLIRAAITALFAVPTVGCSLLLHPTIEGLQPGDGATSADGSGVDVTGVDANGVDVQRPDVVGVDVAPTDTGTCAHDCADTVSCTIDRCVMGSCTHTPDNTMCAGGQVCDPTAGCVARHCTAATDCNDGNACTNDVCTPGGSGTGCTNGPLDADGDGYPALMVSGTTCAGGTDCNDMNPGVHPGATEICNSIDDDCDGVVDNVPGGCPAMNDTCASAQAVSFSGAGMMLVRGTTAGATSEVTSSCGRTGGPDVWYAVTYPSNMVLEAHSAPLADPGDTVLVARSACTAPDIICDDDVAHSGGVLGRGSRLWIRPEHGATGPRTIYIIVDSYDATSPGMFDLNLRVYDDPAPATCGSTTIDLGPGGAVSGRLPNRAATQGTCTPLSITHSNDDLYLISSTVDGQYSVSATGPNSAAGPWNPSFYVRTDCTTMSSEIGCWNAGGGGGGGGMNFNHTGSDLFLFVDNGVAGAIYSMTVVAP